MRRKITHGSLFSGIGGAELKSSPVTSLAKMLLESPRWWSSRGIALEWKNKRTYSERIIELRRGEGGTPSKGCVETSKRRDIPSSRLLFQLAPSTRRTDATGCGFSRNGMETPLLPTPTASDYKRGLRLEYVTGKDGRPTRGKNGMSLTLSEMAMMNMLPTPRQETLPEETSRSSRLNPLFVSEMMGFPPAWLTLPFTAGGGDGPGRR